MNPDNLEQRLRDLPVRSVPGAWREDILQAARQAAHPREESAKAGLAPWWRVWLWPCPEAWAGLAAAWCVILLMHLASGERQPEPSRYAAGPLMSAPIWLALDEEHRLLAGLNSPQSVPFRPPPMVPRPRSDRRSETFAV
jgi:hypothetical protein